MAARFLALGDSYTVGESVAAGERWPVQLAAMLREQGFEVASPEIVATTGWTTSELADGIRQAAPAGPFELVSLLIGVNNQYRGLPLDEYAREFGELLAQAVGFAGGEPGWVLVLSIPDWGVTPFASGRDRARIAREVDAFNDTKRGIAAQVGARYVDTASVSRRAADEPELTAGDGLHPSGALYRLWAELALPQAIAALSEDARPKAGG